MKTLPTNKQEWLAVCASPFKGFIISWGFIFPLWLEYPYYYDELALWGFGYLFTFFALLGIAITQVVTKNERGALWSFFFAAVVLFLAAVCIFYPKSR